MRLAAAALLLALAGCGGAPAGTAAASGSVHLPGPTVDAAPADESPRRGVAVVALGKISSSDGVYMEGEAVTRATRSLARVVYKTPKLRPRADEAVVQVLAGGAPTTAPAIVELADLRAALPTELDTAASKALLEGLARKVDARAFALVSVAPDGVATARLVRLDEVAGELSIRLDPALFTAVAPTAGAPEYVWVGVDTAMVALLGANESGPRAAPAPAPPPPPDDGGSIATKPWFWVIVGGVAALGLTAVIVSQTVDTSSGTVHIQGKVLP
ncbi:MAG: hypothetical protein U0414_10915 [Polyangiaceae bacterium]